VLLWLDIIECLNSAPIVTSKFLI